MQDFSIAYNAFYTVFKEFAEDTYPDGISGRKEKLSDIVRSLPLDNPEYRETNLFLWIVKASLHLIPPVPGGGSNLPVCLILNIVRQIGTVLAAKHHDYGNSARKPSSFFSGLSAADCILIRIGDKIARADRLLDGEENLVSESLADTIRDFIGYAILLYITLYVDGAELHVDPAQGGDAADGDRPILLVPSPITYRELADLVKRGDFTICNPNVFDRETGE